MVNAYISKIDKRIIIIFGCIILIHFLLTFEFAPIRNFSILILSLNEICFRKIEYRMTLFNSF